MANQETCAWIGKSGTKYAYYIYPRHPSVNEGQDGNYIYARKNREGLWVFPCISDRAIFQKERPPIIIEFGASIPRVQLMFTCT